MERPADLFDREDEWRALTAFASDPSPGATLGVVSGRRRQGKSLLLEALCEASGGFYFAATDATVAESLRLLGEQIGRYVGAPGPLALASWEQAVDALLALGRDRPVPVVLDEFPYLCRGAPELPSVIQKAYGPRRRERLGSRTRLVLCGSARSFMGRLLSGTAPLRGRAGLDLVVPTFDFRTAAAFWGIDDPALAVRVHAIVGGTPAYRREYVRNDAPGGLGDFDDWVTRTVLDPSSPLFREARYLLAEGADIQDSALYHSVLAAVAEGHTTRGAIARFVGRRDDALRHPLDVLEDAGFLVRERDPLRQGRSFYRVAEPLVGFYHAVMRPEWAQLERSGRAAEVWARARERWSAAVLGPHFESLCRTWARDFASATTFGGTAIQVGSGVVNDARARHAHEVDVVVMGDSSAVRCLGEAKWGQRMGTDDLERLVRIRSLLAGRDTIDVSRTVLACFGAAGFTDGLRRVAESGGVLLVDLERLYRGS